MAGEEENLLVGAGQEERVEGGPGVRRKIKITGRKRRMWSSEFVEDSDEE